MYDTIIIGAGMSGLAAGIRLAYFGQRVCILERHYTIGGLNSFYRLNGRDYDVGLHAVTNFTPKGTRTGPLARLLRQLRIRWDELLLAPQVGSVVAFPGIELHFSNEFEKLESEINNKFPSQGDNFRRLLKRIVDYNDLDQAVYEMSARQVVEEIIDDPLLVEMIFCPLMWYGNAREHDMDFGQFCIMFRSIYMEGLARPLNGVRLILKHLVRKFRGLGGELVLRTGVEQIEVEKGRAIGVVLDDGNQLTARHVLSSAGIVETMRMCNGSRCEENHSVGQLSFVETLAVLDQQPRQIGCDRTIVFFNDSEKFHWEKSTELCDVRTGVICSPNNYAYGELGDQDAKLPEGMMRVTALANFQRWNTLPESEYRVEKLRWFDRVIASAVRFVPDFRRYIVDTDMFTPKTIRRFTWHDNGAVYGAPEKQWNGITPFENLYICGTDQGFVGIVGAIVSGISMANQHCLRD